MFDRQTDRQTKKERKTKENSLKLPLFDRLIYESGIYMCRPEFGNGELRERPLTENGGGGFQSGPSLKNEGRGVGTKNNKGTYTFKSGVFWSSPCRKSGTNKCIFLKRGVFRCGPGRKRGVFRSGPGRKMGGGLSGGTYPYCPNMGVPPPPHTHTPGRPMGGFRAAHTRTALIWEYPPPHTHTHTGQTETKENH